ncbi:hypothetical protein QE152_g37968 [Popillia japonica]|uniref:Uncharacterized protein n=1 Tax=Popillia japonica TaxID=7064 RepID=A0AAW1I8D3_POPJA
MKRHSEISRRKAQFMNPARAQKLNKFIVNDRFKKLNEVYNNLYLKSHHERFMMWMRKVATKQSATSRLFWPTRGLKECIYSLPNTLESVIIAGCARGLKECIYSLPNTLESVIIAGCVNALGSALSPMIIFKAKRLKPELYDNLPWRSLAEKSAKSVMTN